MNFNKRKNKAHLKGLTLIEIILVLALLGMVVSFIGQKVFSQFKSGKRRLTSLYLAEIKSSLDQYKIDCNSYPQSLEALVQNPGNCPAYDPDGYLGGKRTVPNDPWGCQPAYRVEGTRVFLKSLGDGCQEGGEGDEADIVLED
jgi:general secretion pathway protein G